MPSDALFTAAHLLPPAVLVSHFDLTKYEVKDQAIHFYFYRVKHKTEDFKGTRITSEFTAFFKEVNK